MAGEGSRSGRRRFLVIGGTAVALAGGYPLLRALSEEPRGPWRRGPYGPLRPDPAGILDLPEGFGYRILDRAHDPMADGLRVPSRPDGMACFDTGSELVLVRNHENPSRVAMLGPWTGEVAPEAYSRTGMGGVTRVVLDRDSFAPRSSNLVLGGTVLNCSGGASPWGWLTCEETFSDRHGLVFLCDPTAERIERPRPIPGYGRFRHEAACVDPRSSVCYLTEDRTDSCLYRFVPRSLDEPFEGELQALAIRGRPAFDTARTLRAGQRLEIEWVPVREPQPAEDDIRMVAQADGAARFVRGEGITWDPTPGREGIVVAATAGGPSAAGQIFRIEPDGDGGELVLLAQSEATRDFDMPDGLAVAHETLWFCEDGHDRNFVRGLDGNGRVFDFARNALSRSELAGVCFSPDGRALFVAIQEDGLTLAVTGPFGRA
jgi:secreted PhoX family phosphatase